ncbi:heparan sulfate glucosamine 3-O-sulfotransferase 5-like [Ruditapes philippinarum]|uniref:heparan sulfate glucosamine 3-O-sulfotransferase 5-like n=1 Tax=Ruditapes philippinarum TaxID=129788 RepID=UPI00295B3D24|nr:heparan sulfate glucosamine 3-O-sulfotransferase 5-like [Ruditapes philippinarum]
MYEQVKVMSSHIHYSPLPTNESDISNIHKFAFPKISRLKIVGVTFVILLSVVLVVISCFNKGYCSNKSVCNPESEGNRSDRGQYGKGEHIKFHHMKRRLPQCIIIGARKAGTRALLTYLNIHPGIVVKGEEMHFFDDEDYYYDSLESYRKQMPYSYPDQITIEKTPAYFTEEEVPERIYRMNKTIKLLLIFRDPVERTISDYVQIAEGKKSKNKYVASFEDHVLDSKGNINRSYRAVKSSIYHKHLSRWLEFFSLNQIYIIESKDLVENPSVVMYDVEDFLQIEHEIKPSNFYFNKTKGFYCVKTDTLQKCLADSKGRQHPHVQRSVISKLRRFFAPHNRKLYKMVGTDFHWAEE